MVQSSTILNFLFIFSQSSTACSKACSSHGCGNIFDEDSDLMLLQFRSSGKHADVASIDEFDAVGEGCCKGPRTVDGGKLWAGPLPDFAACKAKCREFGNCGAVEYGWTNNPQWCFIWNDKQVCSSLDAGPGKCGSASDGVRSYKVDKARSVMVAAALRAQLAEQKAQENARAAEAATQRAKDAVARAEAAELNAAKREKHIAEEDAKAKANAEKFRAAKLRAAAKEAEEKDAQLNAAAKIYAQKEAEARQEAKESAKAAKVADEAEEQAHEARALAEEATEKWRVSEDAAWNATHHEELEEAEAEKAKAARKEAIEEDAKAEEAAQKAEQLVYKKEQERKKLLAKQKEIAAEKEAERKAIQRQQEAKKEADRRAIAEKEEEYRAMKAMAGEDEDEHKAIRVLSDTAELQDHPEQQSEGTEQSSDNVQAIDVATMDPYAEDAGEDFRFGDEGVAEQVPQKTSARDAAEGGQVKEVQKEQTETLDIETLEELESQVVGWEELGAGCVAGDRAKNGIWIDHNTPSLEECKALCLGLPNCGAVEWAQGDNTACFIWNDAQKFSALLEVQQCAENEGMHEIQNVHTYKAKRRDPEWKYGQSENDVRRQASYVQ